MLKSCSMRKVPKYTSSSSHAHTHLLTLESAEEGRRAVKQLNNTKRWGGFITVGLAGGVPGKVLRTVVEEERRKVEEAEKTSKDERMRVSWRRPDLF
jgi:hypothetical protein